MATVLITLRIMPDSPEADMERIESDIKNELESEGAKNLSFEIHPIAFGLKAILVKFSLPEEKGTDNLESAISQIDSVSSVKIEEYRRAFG